MAIQFNLLAASLRSVNDILHPQGENRLDSGRPPPRAPPTAFHSDGEIIFEPTVAGCAMLSLGKDASGPETPAQRHQSPTARKVLRTDDLRRNDHA
ncbi:MAG: hypothetical protein WCF00_06020, partial [Azonexus sp.]